MAGDDVRQVPVAAPGTERVSHVFHEQYGVNGPTPGASCTMVYDTNDGVAGVMSFYTNKLDTDDW